MTFCSAYGPLMTQSGHSLARHALQLGKLSRYPSLSLEGGSETAQIHQFNGEWSGICLAVGR